MKKQVPILIVLLIAVNLFSQSVQQKPGSTVKPEILKYHRVLISAGKEIQQRLLMLGITIDHSYNQPEGIVTEISEFEVGILKDNTIPYKILIYDLAKFYESRNAEAIASRPPSAVICNSPVKTPSHFHLGSIGGYFTLLEMENILDSMALLYPNLVKAKQPISTIQSYEGRDIWYVKFSDNPNVDENEDEVLYTALHHGREPASLSQLIFYMWYLLENYATDPDIQETLNNSELFFVPCVNPDGYNYNATTNPSGGGMWRKNRRLNSNNTYGVDLNRNYGFNWGYDNLGSSTVTASDTYRGTAGFSEPETQAMESFCNSRQFKNALNAHTYSNVFNYPWGYIPSFYTPDSVTFLQWSILLTRDSRFLYGTCDQTLGYIVNGSSDDWMYGEQTSKPKIFAMTPEAGTYNDGFWPASSRIIDICKTTFTQNYNLARLAGSYAKIYDEQDKFISGNGYIKYKLRRLGLSGGSFTVSVVPLGTAISSVGAPKIYSSMVQNQLISDSISFAVAGGLTPAQQVKYALAVDNGSIVHHDTITKIFGTPVTLLYDNGSATTANMDTTGSWRISTEHFVSPPSSITDNPGVGTGFVNGSIKTIATIGQMNLQDATYAHLQFYTKFSIAKGYNEAQIQVSTDNGSSYSPLCGMYETSPGSFGGTYPIYDGRQDDWVKEDIDLSAYLGQSIKFRFTLDVDFYMEGDGFYFDDLLIRKLTSNIAGVKTNGHRMGDIIVSPNPSSSVFNVYNPGQRNLEITVYNGIGQIVLQKINVNDMNSGIDLSIYFPGIYFIKLRTGDEEAIKKLFLEK